MPTQERLLVPLQLSLEAIRGLYGHAIANAEALAEQDGMTQTRAGNLCLTYCLASASVLRPVLADARLHESPLLMEIGGPRENRSLAIDKISTDLVRQILRNPQYPFQSVDIYIEEVGEWASYRSVESSMTQVLPWLMLVDPLDETSAIGKGLKVQSTGIMVANNNGSILAGGIASLVDNTVLIVERRDLKARINFSDRENFLQPLPLRVATERLEGTPLRVATLARRIEGLSQTPLFQKKPYVELPTFGGYAVLALLHGTADALIDPVRGQPWHEACIWGPIAELAGLVVTDPQGKPIDFARIMQISRTSAVMNKVPLVISANRAIHREVLSELSQSPQEALLA